MKLKMKLLSMVAALGFAFAGQAAAATAAGTVTLTGDVVINCTVTSPTVALGPIALGSTTNKTFTVDVNCSNTAPWSITSPNIATNIQVGANMTGANAVLMDAAGSAYISTVGVSGTGTGAVQTTTMTVKFISTSGVGVITGTVPFNLGY